MALLDLLHQVRTCQLCATFLPFPPQPILRAKVTARLLIMGQAPGTKVQATGIPWNDPSGHRLREWLQLDEEIFYDETRIAIIPMGFCYPGKDQQGGDLPPRPECAPRWHPLLLKELSHIRLTLLIGQYAQRYYLRPPSNLTETVKTWQHYLPHYFPLPHPSPRNLLWLKRNPWFSQEVLPALRHQVNEVLSR